MVSPVETPPTNPIVEAPIAPTPEAGASLDEPLLSPQDIAEIAGAAPSAEGPTDAPAAPDTATSTPEAEVPAAPDVEELQKTISQLEQWQAEARKAEADTQQQQVIQSIQSARGQYKQNLIDRRSLSDEDAGDWSREVADLNQQLIEAKMNQNARNSYAEHYAQQYKVPVAGLTQYENPETMKLAAESQSKLAALEQRIVSMQATTKATIPAGQFDSGRSSTGIGLSDTDWYSKVFAAGKSNDFVRAAKVAKSLGIHSF